MDNPHLPITVVENQKGWMALNCKELWHYRELFYFLTKRDILVRYKQTVLGVLWALIQPIMTMVVFTIFFGRMAKIPSDGIPYPLFVYAGLLPWTYFSNGLSQSATSLLSNVNLITKIYFPRLILPTSRAIAGLIDFSLSLLILGAMMIYYRYTPTPAILLLPVLILLLFMSVLSFGYWLAALNVQMRDIQYTIPFLLQIWMFISPVIYPVSIVKGKYYWLYMLNPMSGIIHSFRAVLLGTMPINWTLLGCSTIIIIILFLTGLQFFRRMESGFADVI
ncbi:MAG: ABC transporter permease [Chitinivibrionales bacterium]|nr:ABC transporter permease [Chitinivibrionales bacterium]